MTNPIHIISLGAGVQSSTMALMAAKGEITPMPTASVFADTKSEPASVYKWLEWLRANLPFDTKVVSKGNLFTDTLSPRPTGKFLRIDIPAYVFHGGKNMGFINRSCTRDYKIKPIIAESRRIVQPQMKAWREAHKGALKLISDWKKECANAKREAKKNGVKKVSTPSRPHSAWAECQSDPLVVQWIGISLDEIIRMKESQEPWILNRWPLIELRMNRQNCLMWMERNGYPKPVKSSCTFCPYHGNDEWRKLTKQEFAECVDLDTRLRTTRIRVKGELFLHKSGIPLSQVDLSTEEERGQTDMFNNECEGMCGV